MLVLDEADVERLLTMDDALAAVRSALLAVHEGAAVPQSKPLVTLELQAPKQSPATPREGTNAR